MPKPARYASMALISVLVSTVSAPSFALDDFPICLDGGCGTAAGSFSDKMDTLTVPVSAEWKEYIVPLARVGGDSAYGIKQSHVVGTSVDLLIDSVRFTDGTGLHPLSIPPVVHNPVPADWGRSFLLGSFDNRELGKSTKAQQAGLAYRYQQVMPDIKTYYSRSVKGYVYDQSMFSDTLGVKTAIVWYNLGKVGEGWSPVTANLASPVYMAVGIADRRAPASRSRKPVLSISARGTPVVAWPGESRATLRNLRGRRVD